MSVTKTGNDVPLSEEDEIKLLKRLPSSLVCGFSLPPRLRKHLLKSANKISLYELHSHFVKRPQIARDRRSISIYFIANSKYERNSLTEACVSFHDNMRKSRNIIRPDSDRLAWVIPSNLLDAECHNDNSCFDDPRLVEILTSSTSKEIMTECKEWLPWISLGIVTLVRRWRTPRINKIRRTIFKLAKYLDGESGAFFPWESNFDKNTAHIPIQALYQFETTKLMEDTISDLTTLGLLSINHLRFLHPDAVSLANHPKQPLLKLYTVLNR